MASPPPVPSSPLGKNSPLTTRASSTIVISITGPKAEDNARRPRLAAFSSTYRLERRLRFNHLTQCARCQLYGLHTLRCTNDHTCRWGAGKHTTTDHTCPVGEDL